MNTRIKATLRYSLVIASAFICLCSCGKSSPPEKLSDAERAKIAEEIRLLSAKGYQALNNNDLVNAQGAFLTASQQPGADDLPETARALEGLSSVQQLYKQNDKAVDNLQKAISIDEKQHLVGGVNPDLIRELCQLANLYQEQGKLTEEKDALTRAVKEGASLGPKACNGAYVSCLLSLGVIYKNEGEPLKAEALLRHALDMSQISPGPNFDSIIANLADVLKSEGRIATAQTLLLNKAM